MPENNIEVDENDNIIGIRPRTDFYNGKHIHRAVQLILENSKKEILIQKRAPTKIWYPNLYTFSVSGTVKNEPPEKCILTETEEEIGIKIIPKFLFKYPHFDEQNKAIHYVYKAKSDNIITPDKTEMTEAVWVKKDTLKKDIEMHPEKYTPPFVKGMRIYFKENIINILK